MLWYTKAETLNDETDIMLYKYGLFIIAFFSFISFAGTLNASNSWRTYEAPNGLFVARFPAEADFVSHTIRNSEETVLNSGELVAIVDQRPFKNAVKSYIVKFDQTIGQPFTLNEIKAYISSAIEDYVAYYGALNGTIKNKTIIEDEDGYITGEIDIKYEDEDMGAQGVNVRIKMSDYTKYEQIISGPDHIMYALEAKNFFSTFKMNYGQTKLNKSFSEDWVAHEAPSGLFTILLPESGNIFAPYPPR